jgi:hypothetical protein
VEGETVTEAEWLTCNNPQKLLIFLAKPPAHRKMLLFAIACCKRLETMLIDERSREALGGLERFAEGEFDLTELDQGSKLAHEAIRSIGQSQLQLDRRRRNGVPGADLKEEADRLHRLDNAAWAVYAALMGAKYKTLPAPYSYGAISFMNRCRAALGDETDGERLYQANVLRDIFGNPFRPVSIAPAILTWNDSTVVRLAQAAYDERHMPEGTLDNGRLAILADALEEAGCTNQDILGHLRGPGPHVRGCWAVDLCLGRKSP